MIEFLRSGGIPMLPLLAIAVVIAVQSVRAWHGIARTARPDAILETRIDAIAFWGGFGVVIGAIGTLGGIAQAAHAIARAGGASAPLIWGGLYVALSTILVALAVFAAALLLWFGLRVRYRRRAGAATA